MTEDGRIGAGRPAALRLALRVGAPLAAALLAVACSSGTGVKVGEEVAKAATQQPTWQQHPSSNKPRKHVVVQFSDASLHPSIARVTAGGDVAWINYTTGYTGAVVFPASFADALSCGQPGPRFGKVASGYQSIPITGEGAEDVALPCPLRPGEYEYVLYLFEGRVSAPGANMFDPNHTMQGKIIVE